MNRFLLKEIRLDILEFILICVRPTAIYLIWNYLIAFNSTIPRINVLQVIGLVILIKIIITYIPTVDMSSYFSKNVNKNSENE